MTKKTAIKTRPHQKFDRTKLVPAICTRLSTGEPMAVICRELKLNIRTVNHWREVDKAIADQFADARDLGYDAIAARLRDTARGKADSTQDVQRDKLIIDTDLKLLAKWDPRRYGDKTAVEHTGPNGGPIQSISATTTDPIEAARIYQQVMSGEK